MNKEEKIKMLDKILKAYGVDWKLEDSYEGNEYYQSLVKELKELMIEHLDELERRGKV